MLQIRNNVFETNSSSTHSICITTKNKFQEWVNGNVYYSSWCDKFVDKDEVINEANKIKSEYYNEDDDVNRIRQDEVGAYTFEEIVNDNCLTYFQEEYTSPSGDEIVVFGQYGNDW